MCLFGYRLIAAFESHVSRCHCIDSHSSFFYISFECIEWAICKPFVYIKKPLQLHVPPHPPGPCLVCVLHSAQLLCAHKHHKHIWNSCADDFVPQKLRCSSYHPSSYRCFSGELFTSAAGFASALPDIHAILLTTSAYVSVLQPSEKASPGLLHTWPLRGKHKSTITRVMTKFNTLPQHTWVPGKDRIFPLTIPTSLKRAANQNWTGTVDIPGEGEGEGGRGCC